MDEIKEHQLYDIVFNYNTYEQMWYAFPRIHWSNYWANKMPKGSFLKGKNINHLVEAINYGSIQSKEVNTKSSNVKKNKRGSKSAQKA